MRRIAVLTCTLTLGACQPPVAAPPAPAPAPASVFSGPMRLIGTEPFWSVRIGDEIVLERPEQAPLAFANAGPTIEGAAAVWTARDLTIRLEKGECSDGMSDNRYPYRATVILRGDTLRGCAAAADQWPRGG